jgi:hypothetical protein
MNFEIVELIDFSGQKAGVYSIVLENTNTTLFDQFINENTGQQQEALDSILSKLILIGHKTGAKEQFFKLNEGNLGDGICALYDSPDKKLRLYCIRYGNNTIVIGGGGAKEVRTLQEDPKLKQENYLLRAISKIITEAIKNQDITWDLSDTKLIGNLIFDNNETI